MNLLTQFLIVGCGGALGAASRYGISQLVELGFKGPFPLGTLVANSLGCLLVGILLGSGQDETSESLRLGLGVGFLGGLTTFSTFSAETHRHLTRDGEWMLGLANMGLNLAVGLAAVIVGVWIGRRYLQAS